MPQPIAQTIPQTLSIRELPHGSVNQMRILPPSRQLNWPDFSRFWSFNSSWPVGLGLNCPSPSAVISKHDHVSPKPSQNPSESPRPSSNSVRRTGTSRSPRLEPIRAWARRIGGWNKTRKHPTHPARHTGRCLL